MSRPLSLLAAVALASSVAATMIAPASARIGAAPSLVTPQGTLQLVADHRHHDWNNNDWRWRNREHRRHRHYAPGFSFNFGVPFPHVYSTYVPPRDCYRTRDGRLYCRAN